MHKYIISTYKLIFNEVNYYM